MSEPLPITIPMLNPNEAEARLVSLAVKEGQPVEAGDCLATLETTKSISDLTTPASGFIAGLRFQEGDTARAGEVLCYVAASLDTPLPLQPAEPSQAAPEDLPAGLRITQPARELARQAGMDLGDFPVGPLVTEALVRTMIQEMQPRAQAQSSSGQEYGPNAIVVYGGGGHGKMVIDLIRLLDSYAAIGVVDDGLAPGGQVLGMPVLGGGSRLVELRRSGLCLGANAVGGIGNIPIRVKVSDKLERVGLTCPALIHPAAFVESSAEISPGGQVFAHAYVGSAARTGPGVIVNTGVIISHDCQIGAFAILSPGAILAGGVEIGEQALVGMGVTVNLGVNIGPGARVGNGATVKADVPAGGIVRAGKIWPE